MDIFLSVLQIWGFLATRVPDYYIVPAPKAFKTKHFKRCLSPCFEFSAIDLNLPGGC